MTHNYLHASGKLLRETYGNVTLDFLYDNSGYPYALIYKNGTAAPQTYYYITNLKGDVLYLLDSAETVVAAYEYSPYGEVTTTVTSTIAEINPLRYRGYYYDTETGLYYLQNRFYDASIGRFLNPDDICLLGANADRTSLNLYVYCGNNPVFRNDTEGEFWLEVGIFIGASAIIGGLAGAFTAACTGGNVLEGALEGAALGAVAAAATVFVPEIVAPLATAASALVTTATGYAVAGTVTAAVVSGAATFAVAAVGGAAVDYTTQAIVHELSDEADKEFIPDGDRIAKTALLTGVGAMVPTCGDPSASVSNAVGASIIGLDAAFINASIEIFIVRMYDD